jgi:spermidine synthase
MNRNRQLAEAITPEGARLILHEHGGSFCIRLNGRQLMHSAGSTTEVLLGELALKKLHARADPRILIGGLGLGFTLRSVLERVGPFARVQVAELIPEVVQWNRRFLAHLNGGWLDDPRVEIYLGDLWNLLTVAGPPCYDALLLDVDNGPRALFQQQNGRLYGRQGLRHIAAKLKSGSRVVFWSADPAPSFATRLVGAGFKVTPVPTRLHPTAERCAGMIYVADRP